MPIPTTAQLFDLSHSLAAPLLAAYTRPWEALPHLAEFLLALGPTLPAAIYEQRGEHIWVARDARVSEAAHLSGPLVICPGAEIRPGAYIRGSVLVGAGAVVGNSTEVKNAILFDGVQLPHYNYAGDSILGYRAHMGAGAVASNFRADHGSVTVRCEGEEEQSGLRKLGALLGDCAEIGCNSVLCPGAVVGREAVVYPLSRVRGYIPARTVYKGEGQPVPRRMQ